MLVEIGGAERLVVDSVLALQKRGHEVEVFTSFHQDGPNGRSFEETRNGKYASLTSSLIDGKEKLEIRGNATSPLYDRIVSLDLC